METRKWTDQASGQDKYTTEVVIPRFGGVMTFLGGRDDAGGAPRGGDDGGYQPRASSAPAKQPARGGSPSWEPSKGGDLDDEIPF